MTMIALVAPGQKDEFAKLVSANLRKNADGNVNNVLAELERRGVIRSDNFQRVLAQGNKVNEYVNAKVAEALNTIVAELAENRVGRLRLISGGERVAIAATNGKDTLAKAKDVFYYIDPNFKNWGTDKKFDDTPETEVAVYETIEDGTFVQYFGGFGENFNRLCLTQAQIKAFCRDNRQWLRTDCYATFFLFKVGFEFFVASVRVFADGLHVCIGPFSGDDVWNGEYRRRIVVPKLIVSTQATLAWFLLEGLSSSHRAFFRSLPTFLR